MTETAVSKARKSLSSKVGLCMSLGMGLTFACCDAALAQATPNSVPHNPGVWQKHEYSFAFLGFTSTYSCDGLASKLKLLLLAAGARPDAKASAGACASGFGRPDKFARADLTFYTLTPLVTATSMNTSSSTNKTRDKSTPSAAVDGSWIRVALEYEHPNALGRGDCELVDEFRANLLPLFTTRNVENHTTCIPYQESGSNIDLKFESFGVAPKLTPQHG